jgi:hypothetical protein
MIYLGVCESTILSLGTYPNGSQKIIARVRVHNALYGMADIKGDRDSVGRTMVHDCDCGSASAPRLETKRCLTRRKLELGVNGLVRVQ